MQLCIFTLGSRGDVQPYVALARGLGAAGHDVALCAAPMFRSFIEQHGVEFRSFDTGDPQAIIHSEEGRALLRDTKNPIVLLRELCRLLEPMIEKGFTEAVEAVSGAEALLVSPTALTFGQALRERSGLPVVPAFLQPNHPTRAFANWMFPDPPRWLPLRGALCKLSHHFAGSLIHRLIRGANDAARARVLGLPPARNPFRCMLEESWPTLYGFSSSVVPRPADWARAVEITGYWFLPGEPGWQPPRALVEFLGSGPPPVCVGFGSMPAPDPRALAEDVVRALALAGKRGILLSGWGGLGEVALPDTVLALQAVPHDWLFPRVAAVVHHGGAGTTAAALRAGVPSLIVPFIADQRFWGGRVAALGAGPGCFPRKRLTPERFAAALRRLCDTQAYRDGARAVATRLAAEDGVGRAVVALQF